MAIVGAAWAPFAFIAFVLAFSAHSVPAGSYHGPGPWQWLLIFTVLPLGVTAPFGTTICGAVAISQIRHSAGKLYGLGLAVFDALLFPLLILDALVAAVCRFGLLSALVYLDYPGRHGPLLILVWLAIVIPANWLIICWAWRAVRRPIETLPGQHPSPPGRGAGGEGTPGVGQAFPLPSQSGGDAAALHSARRAVKAPAIGLQLAAAVHLLLVGGVAIYFIVAANPAMVMGAGLSLLVNAYVAIAASGMSQLQNYRRSLIGSILATGLSLSPLGLLFGIWALVILTRREVIEAFKTPNKGEDMRKARALIWALIAITVIVTSAGVWAASRTGQAPKSQPATQPSSPREPFLAEYMRRAIADELHARGVRFRDVKVTPLVNTAILDCTFTTLEELKGRDGGNVWTLIRGTLRIDWSNPDVMHVQGYGDLGHVAFTIRRADLSPTQPAASAPRVLRTAPAAFADDVDPALDKITVTFDRPMMDKSWSWTGGGDTYPERAGEISYDAARTTCTLPVKLHPGKVYWVGVNSPSHRNFKTPDRVPASACVILFATRSDDGKPTPLPVDLVRQARQINAAVGDPSQAEKAQREAKKLQLVNWVEKFFSENYRDITARKTLEWGEPETTAGGNLSIRYKFLATIWNKDQMIIEQRFTFTPEGKYVSAETIEKGPASQPATQPAARGLPDLPEDTLKGKLINWVEKFFSENYRDITARKTLEWGEPEKSMFAGGYVAIRYKYLATIWNKDQMIIEQRFTFTPEGKYVSAETIEKGPATQPTTQPATQPTTQAAVADAMAATQAWLALIDEGKTEASWEQAAKSFRSSITKDNWAAALKVAREPLGKLRSRKLITSTYTTSLPGAPDGQYVIVQFETVFENKPQTVETLTPMLEADGKWRISGYYVN